MDTSLVVDINALLSNCRKASKSLLKIPASEKNKVLNTLATLLEEHTSDIISANGLDMSKMDDSDPKKDRLMLDAQRIKALASSVREIANLEDPCNQVLLERTLENGIKLSKVTAPMGVVGAIFESRPNVTIDIAALCLKSSNGCVLRGGSDAWHSNSILVDLIHQALRKHSIDSRVVVLFPTDRAYVSDLLSATRFVDLIIPRGSQSLIQFVRDNSKIPTIETGAGVCHTYVSEFADVVKAARIVVNAKVTRPSVCNSLDTIVVHQSKVDELAQLCSEDLAKFKVRIYADLGSYVSFKNADYPFLYEASEDSFGTEFLDYACSVKTVSNFDQALDHIEQYSSRHSEAIVSENEEECRRFIEEVDAAAVYSNASTRFTDGGVFGLGAEIGISTQKLHARGPFALEKLVTEKWIGIGSGQIR